MSLPDCNPPSPSPSSGPTYVGLDQADSLCSTNHPSQILTGILIRILREHFSNSANLEYNGENEYRSNTDLTPTRQLQDYVWNQENNLTKIQIQAVWDYNPQDIQRRPALYIKRNTLQPQKIAIANGFTLGPRRDKNNKIVEVRGEYQSVQILGSHTVFCVGTTGAEAELLGMEVMNQLMMFGSLIEKDMKFNRFGVLEVGEVALLDEFDAHFVVPVVVGYGFPWTWRIGQIAPWLKTLSISVVPS